MRGECWWQRRREHKQGQRRKGKLLPNSDFSLALPSWPSLCVAFILHSTIFFVCVSSLGDFQDAPKFPHLSLNLFAGCWSHGLEEVHWFWSYSLAMSIALSLPSSILQPGCHLQLHVNPRIPHACPHILVNACKASLLLERHWSGLPLCQVLPEILSHGFSCHR